MSYFALNDIAQPTVKNGENPHFKLISFSIVILVLLLLVVGFVAPQDIFSTAYWYDSLEIRKVYSDIPDTSNIGVFAKTVIDAFHLPVVFSTEALVVSVVIWCAQVYFGFEVAVGTIQNWWLKGDKTANYFTVVTKLLLDFLTTRKNNNKKRIDRKAVNMSRVINTSIFWTLVVFDTWTDVGYKLLDVGGLNFDILTLEAILLSLVLYNFGSEWAILTLPDKLKNNLALLLPMLKIQKSTPTSANNQKATEQSKKKNQPPQNTSSNRSQPPVRPQRNVRSRQQNGGHQRLVREQR